MELEDRLVIATPEGVQLELTLAGLGSRFVAEVIDVVLEVLVLALAAVALDIVGLLGIAVFAILAVVVVFGYHPLFELCAGGRTPGKRRGGLRVVERGGGAIGVRASLVRNILRIVDFLPALYLIGSVAILVTPRNQRLGDLAGGTLVVRERGVRDAAGWAAPPAETELPESLESWDVSAVSTSDLATVRAFLERRTQLDAEARSRVCRELCARLRPKVGGVPEAMGGEPFLEALVRVKEARA
jgi:uncharacterized RDD family membrane protein YckC